MVRQWTFLVIVSCVFILSFLPQRVKAFSFNEIETKSSKQKISIENVKHKITKELFFDVMKSKVMKIVTADTSSYDLTQTLSPNMRYSAILAFDENGNSVTTWQEEYPTEYVVIPNSYAFDMILANSYGLPYKPSDYYKKSEDNLKKSYYGCDDDFDDIVGDLLGYYVDGEELFLEQAKNRLIEWKDPKIKSEWRDNLGDCFLPTFQFANDYNEFIKAQLSYFDDLKKAKQENLAKEQGKKRQAEEEKKRQEQEKEKLAKLQHKKMIDALTLKWKNFGIPTDMLVSQIRTYAGIASSGDLTTLVEFIDKLLGNKKWETKGDLFILHQQRKDELTGKTHKASWGFYDLRKKQGCIWLERVIIDGQEYPSNQLFYLVTQVISK